MTDEEVYENVELGFPALQQPPLYPPNAIGTVMQFWLDAPNRVGDQSGFREFRFVQTWWFPNGKALQIWEGFDGWYCSRIGRREQLRFCGDIKTIPTRYRDLYPEDDDHE
ncbi:hypothetical protein V3589_20635 [Sinorhizobium fredii]|uniref:hypothetical protein n=1 Tax=Rhizobium fredii TaxID=380 RepID=UPI00309BE758